MSRPVITDPFAAAPNPAPVKNLCRICGWEPPKLHRGKVPGHFQWRINGLGEPYESRDWCPGGGQYPEVVDQ